MLNIREIITGDMALVGGIIMYQGNPRRRKDLDTKVSQALIYFSCSDGHLLDHRTDVLLMGETTDNTIAAQPTKHQILHPFILICQVKP